MLQGGSCDTSFVNIIDFLTAPAPDALFKALIEPVPDCLPVQGGEGTADILRLDRLHPQISGNKAFKLLGYLRQWQSSGHRALLSFGGVWSNHLYALSALGQRLNVPVIAMVRGYADQPDTDTLRDCRAMGAQLQFCDRVTYARRGDSEWCQQLFVEYDALVIPEGGDGVPGEWGFRFLASMLAAYDQIWLAAGTGTTARGIAAVMPVSTTLTAINAVADQGALKRRLNPGDDRIRVLDTYHYGRFGRCPPELRDLIARYDAAGLPLDPVYTAKLMAAWEQEKPSGRVLLIHTGGLQGRRGYGLSYPVY